MSSELLLKLHTLARHHCIDIINNHEWDEKNDFYYYQVYDAILKGIECLRPQDYKYFESLKNDIIYMSEITDTDNTFTMAHYGNKKLIDLYRRKFKSFISNIKEDDVKNVAPLFYRRVLRGDELEIIKKELLNYWSGKNDAWFPPFDLDFEKDLLNFNDKYFSDSQNIYLLIEILKRHKYELLYEFRWGMEFGVSYEIDLDYFGKSFYYDMYERFWTTRDFSAVFYVHHDELIGFAGSWLCEEIKNIFPDWSNNLFKYTE